MFPVGVAGCGRMGAPMLAALRRAGFDARGFDIRAPDEFGALAPYVSNDAAEFGSDLRTLITVVRDAAQTEDVLFGAKNLVEAAPNLQTLIISSTVSPRFLQGLAGRLPDRIEIVDAPMSGAQIAAQTGTLSFMVGASPEARARLQPLFSAMGRHVHHMGPVGAGMQAKVLNNLLAASHTVMTRLVLDWADDAGLKEVEMLNLIHTSSGQNWLASGFDDIEFSRDGYSAENSIGILKKDVESAIDAASPEQDQRLPQLLAKMVADLKPRRT